MDTDDHRAPRRYFDADSHVLEPVDWLTPVSPTLPSATGCARSELAVAAPPTSPPPRSSTGRLSRRALDGRSDCWGRGYRAFGALGRRASGSAILDKHGIDAQLVFSTFAPGQFLSERPRPPLRRGARPHPRRSADFCSADPRLLAGAARPVRRHRSGARGARRRAGARVRRGARQHHRHRRGRWARATLRSTRSGRGSRTPTSRS